MADVLLTEQRLRTLLTYGTLIAVAMLFGLMLVFFPYFIPFLIVIGVVWLVVIFKWPMVALISYVLVILMRPGEVLAIPFIAKAVAGSCLLVWVFQVVRRKELPKVSPAYKAMLVFVAAVAASTITAFWLEQVLMTWQNTLKLLLLYTLIVSFADTARKLAALGVTILVAVAYTGAYVIYQMLAGAGGSGLRIYELAWGIFADSNEFSQVIVMLIPILVLLLMEVKAVSWRTLYLATIGICMTILVMSASRGGFLGLMVVAVGLTMKTNRKLVLSFIVVVTLGSALLLAPSSYFERISSITDYAQDESASGRLDAWAAGMRMTLTNPATGIGAGCFEDASENYGLERGMVAHNSFITVLAETGLLGFSAYILIIFYTFRSCRQINGILEAQGRQHGLLFALAQALPISMTGYIVTAMFISTTYYPQLFILSAITNAALNLAVSQSGARSETTQPALTTSGAE